jgi:hypothetical protein
VAVMVTRGSFGRRGIPRSGGFLAIPPSPLAMILDAA